MILLYSRVSEAIGGALMAVLFLWALGIGMLVGVAALITWVVKKVWYADSKPKQKKQKRQKTQRRSDDWLYNAQVRQQKRYEYGDPYFAKKQPEPEQKDHKVVFESGWTWNEKTKLWEPPSNASAESKKKWEWDAERQIWVDVEQQKRLERYKAFREKEGKGPTYEEWKAAREAERNKENN